YVPEPIRRDEVRKPVDEIALALDHDHAAPGREVGRAQVLYDGALASARRTRYERPGSGLLLANGDRLAGGDRIAQDAALCRHVGGGRQRPASRETEARKLWPVHREADHRRQLVSTERGARQHRGSTAGE